MSLFVFGGEGLKNLGNLLKDFYYSILQEADGIIADLNVQFKALPGADYMQNYDFFVNSNIENSFFGAKASSIFIKKIIDRCDLILEERKDVGADSFFKHGFMYVLEDNIIPGKEYSEKCYEEDNSKCLSPYTVVRELSPDLIGYDIIQHSWWE